MANKDRNKRSVRKARAEERERVEAARAAQGQASSKGGSKTIAKASSSSSGSKTVAAQKNKKPGFFKRIGLYLQDVKTELRRVVWPSRPELKSYSVAVIVMLIVFGVILWLVDSGLVAVLAAYTGLRG